MKALVLVGGISLLLGLYGALGKLFVSRGGTVGESGSAYQLAWPFFMRLSNPFLLVGAGLLLSALVVRVA